MLSGEKVRLRAWKAEDLEPLCALRNDVQLQALLMAQARPNTLDRTREWLVDRSTREDGVFFVIADRGNDEVLGYVQVAAVDRFHGRGELGICLGWPAHGRGLAAEACELLEQYLRDVIGLRKLSLRVLASNARAIAFYRRHGYRDVGTLRQDHRSGDQYNDVVLMERLLA